MDKLIETTATDIIVDVPVPTTFTLDKVVLGTIAGVAIGAGATVLALKLKEMKARKDAAKLVDADSNVTPITK